MDGKLRLHVSEEGADAEREAWLLGDLREELRQCGIGTVTAEAWPGALVVTTGPAANLPWVLSAIRDWLRRGVVVRGVRLTLDDDELVMTTADTAVQGRLIAAFLGRHGSSVLDLPSGGGRAQGTAFEDITRRGVRGFERETTRGFRGIPDSFAAPDTEETEETGETEHPGPEATAELNVAADMPSLVQVGKIVSVACHISRDEIDAVTGRVRDQGRVDADPARPVTVQVLPKANVEVVGEDRADLPVPGTGQSADAFFDVRPTQAGMCLVWIVIRQGPVPLLTLRLESAAVTEPAAGPAVRYPARASVAVGGATGLEDVTWLSVVEMDRGEDTVYRYELRSTTLGILATFESPPLRRRSEYVANLYREIESRWLSTSGDVTAFGEELREFGGSLLSQLFPERLQAILWRYRDRLRDMMVLSSEPFIPWELVHLKEPGQPLPDETCFLAQIGLVRWLYTRDNAYPPQTLRARPGRVHVLCPDYPEPSLRLPQTRGEARFLTESLGASEVTPDELPVRALLRSGGIDILHFAGHGLADGGDIANAKLLLKGRLEHGKYIESWLSATTVEQQAKLAGPDGSKPLVVLNACQAGRLGPQMSSLGGFAQAFLERGAGAFISSMWSVGDRPASTFVTTMYEELLHGQTISDATSTAREKARRAGDGTWLAYAVYAHPKAHLLTGTDAP